MTIPPSDPGPRHPGRGPTSGLDPMPRRRRSGAELDHAGRRPRPPAPDGLPGDPPGDLPLHELPDDVPDPTAPGVPRRPPEVPAPGRMIVVATGREDRRRHVVEVAWGEVGDPTGLRARCGASVETVVPGRRAEQADCPECRSDGYDPSRSPG